MAAMCDAGNRFVPWGAAVVAGALEKMPQLTSVDLRGKLKARRERNESVVVGE